MGENPVIKILREFMDKKFLKNISNKLKTISLEYTSFRKSADSFEATCHQDEARKILRDILNTTKKRRRSSEEKVEEASNVA